MSRRADLIAEWVAGHPQYAIGAARRAGELLQASNVLEAIAEVAADPARPANSRRRDVLAAKRLARELARHDLFTAGELVAILDFPTPPSGAPRARVDVDELLAAAARRWPESSLRTSMATVAIVLTAGARLTARQAAAARWADIDLQTGAVAGGDTIAASMLTHLVAHQRLLEELGELDYVLPALKRGSVDGGLQTPTEPMSTRTLQRLVTAARPSN